MNRLLQKSLEERTPVEMIYISSTNSITQRIIVVTEIYGSTIRAYCYMRKQTRLFKLENILSVMAIREPRQKYS
jgi:predicted DNA-binding transcriptional regulator YafY